MAGSPFPSFQAASDAALSFLQEHYPMGLWMVTRTSGDDWIVLQAKDRSYDVTDGDLFRWSDSFCSRMVLGHAPHIAPDSQQIPAYASAPIGQQIPIASYIGFPLGADGARFGTLGAMDTVRNPTVLDDIRVSMDDDSELAVDYTRQLPDALEQSVEAGRLRADHYLHLRCEVSTDDCLEAFAHFDGDGRVRLASLMDHAPGQRQFARIEAYAAYYIGKLKMSEDVFRAYCEKRLAESARNSAPNRAAIAEACKERGIVLASHDDATRAHVGEAVQQGITVAEFPTTAEAAKASRQAGLGVLMGAPNVVRGGSHSGNVSARALAEEGLLDILSSDYIPFSLIQSAFYLGEVVDGISLPQAVAMVSKTPAEIVGLTDRGAILAGRRADLVRVRVDEHVPVVRTVWREGRRVA